MDEGDKDIESKRTSSCPDETSLYLGQVDLLNYPEEAHEEAEQEVGLRGRGVVDLAVLHRVEHLEHTSAVLADADDGHHLEDDEGLKDHNHRQEDWEIFIDRCRQ